MIDGLTAGTEYQFTFAAKSAQGKYSAESTSLTVKTADAPKEEEEEDMDRTGATTAIILIFLFVILAIIIVVVGARFVKKDKEAKSEEKDFDKIPENNDNKPDEESPEVKPEAEQIVVPKPNDDNNKLDIPAAEDPEKARRPTMKIGGAAQVIKREVVDDDAPQGESTIKSEAQL